MLGERRRMANHGGRRGWLIGAALACLAFAPAARGQQLLPPEAAAPAPPINLGRPVPLVPPPPPGAVQPVPPVLPAEECRPASAFWPGDAAVLADFWHVGQSRLRNSQSELVLSQLGVGYEMRFPTDFALLTARPQFTAWFLGGPTRPGPHLPEQVYGLSVALQAEYRFTPRLVLTAGITPGLYTDFQNTGGEMFRVPAEVVGSFAYLPDLVLVGGILYTAQPGRPVLPVVGAVWLPAEDWRLELVFPRPRVVYRRADGLELYGQFAWFGGAFAVDANGRDDLLQYRDWRLAIGAEWAAFGRSRVFFEFGAAVWRELELERHRAFDVDPAFYFRVGGRF